MAELKVEEAETDSMKHDSRSSSPSCVWFYVLLIINVWEFCQKSWACGSFCSSVSVVVCILNGTQM